MTQKSYEYTSFICLYFHFFLLQNIVLFLIWFFTK